MRLPALARPLIAFSVSIALSLAARAASAPAPLQGFNFTSISNRVLTPNGDGKNDGIVVRFENPQFSAVTGRIYDLKGAQVAAMRPGPLADTTLSWDGRAENSVVRGGLYIFIIEAEGKRHRGTVLVVR